MLRRPPHCPRPPPAHRPGNRPRSTPRFWPKPCCTISHMGDRFDRLGARHPNVEALLRRPGIGHNNGPTFDMSWEAWVWRRATAKAWKQPSPEVAKMRIRRAERLGITYKELAAALMNTGSNLGAAVMPLSLAARVRRGAKGEIIVEPRNFVAALVGQVRRPAVPAGRHRCRAGAHRRGARRVPGDRQSQPRRQGRGDRLGP